MRSTPLEVDALECSVPLPIPLPLAFPLLSSEQPFACIFENEKRSFLGGGGETPPSPESDDDASIAKSQYGLLCRMTTNQQKAMDDKQQN